MNLKRANNNNNNKFYYWNRRGIERTDRFHSSLAPPDPPFFRFSFQFQQFQFQLRLLSACATLQQSVALSRPRTPSRIRNTSLVPYPDPSSQVLSQVKSSLVKPGQVNYETKRKPSLSFREKQLSQSVSPTQHTLQNTQPLIKQKTATALTLTKQHQQVAYESRHKREREREPNNLAHCDNPSWPDVGLIQ